MDNKGRRILSVIISIVIIAVYAFLRFQRFQAKQERQKAQQEFESKAASLDDSGKQALGEKLSQQVAKREQDLMGPIQKKVQKAIATVAKRAGINSVVDSSAMLYGGKDLTGDVIAEVLK